MNVQHENLSDVFAPVSVKPAVDEPRRGAKLEGILSAPAPRTRRAVSQPQKAVQAPVEAKPAPTPAAAPPVSENADTGPENKGAYIPLDLLKKLRARRNVERSTYTDILIDAFDAVSDEELRNTLNPSAEGFGEGMPRRRRTTEEAKSGTQIQLRLDSAQEAWLDAKKAAVGAKSRSALVTVAYQLYFAKKPQHRKH